MVPSWIVWRFHAPGEWLTTIRDRGPLLISESIDPAENVTDQAFNAWYRQTYIKEVSQLKGWRRTSRFENTMRGNGARGEEPRWLALHEFEDGAFEGTGEIVSLLGQSEETRAMEKNAKQRKIMPFKLAREYGNRAIFWGDVEEEIVVV